MFDYFLISESSDEEIPEELPQLQMSQPQESPELKTLFGTHKFITESPKKVATASVPILNVIDRRDSNLSPSDSVKLFLEESSEEEKSISKVKKPLIVELD